MSAELVATETLEIEKLVYGGDGLGRLPSGEIVFVPWSVPGDRLTVSRVPGTQKPPRAKIESILEPSPERTEPACSIFGTCGGCQWQHISQAAQREWKRKIVQESLTRIGKLPDVVVMEPIGSDDAAWHYRNRVQWEIEPEDESWATPKYRLGYHEANSHTVVPFDHCWIMNDALNPLADWLQTYLHEHPAVGSGLLRIEATINAAQKILIRLMGEKNPDVQALATSAAQAFPAIIGVVHSDASGKTSRTLYGHASLLQNLGGYQFKVSAGSFFQTNPLAAERMLDVMREWFLPDARSLLDVYAGVGAFAVCLQERAQRITVVENSPSAVADARENIAQATNITLKAADARSVLRMGETFDVAIVDPPRAGCHADVLAGLSKHVKRQLIYVSCNPTTLARDLKTLVADGWRIEAVQPIDMFPQTYHVETLVNLVR